MADDVLQNALQRIGAVDTGVSRVAVAAVRRVLVVDAGAFIAGRQVEAEVDVLASFSPKSASNTDLLVVLFLIKRRDF